MRKEHAGSRVLVVGHTNTIPELIAAYGLPRPPDVPHSEYDNLFVLLPRDKGPAELIQLHF